jgi:mannosyltransferase PIG-V
MHVEASPALTTPAAVRRAIRAALPVVVGTRPALFLVGYLAVIVFGYPGGRPPVRDFDDELLNLPSRADARWYVQIAREGYSYDARVASTVQQNVVCFPVFPMAIRLVARILGNRHLSFYVAGTLLSLAAFLAGLAYLYLFAREEMTDDQATAALWLLAAYPFSLFYGAVYTESFFLLEAVATFYHFRRRQFVRAGLWGLLAGLTRPNGCLLAAPLALIAVGRWLPPWVAREKPPVHTSARPAAGPALATAAPVLGMLIYSLALWRWFDSPWGWIAAHEAWGQTYHGIGALIADRLGIMSHAGFLGYVASLPHDFLNALGVLFVLGAVWPVARSLGAVYALWILLTILPPVATGGLISAGRYTSVLFPVFVWLGRAVPARHLGGWIASFAVIQALCATMFYTWRPLY